MTFSENYNYLQGSDNYFELLLSTRHSRIPMFFTLNPSQWLQEVESKVITLGSGKDLLDDLLLSDFNQRIQEVLEAHFILISK